MIVSDPRDMDIGDFIFDKRSHSPVYLQLASQIQGAIRYNNFDPTKPLPSLKDFERKLGLSATTVIRAYGHLHRSGLVKWKKGVGFFCIVRS